MAELEPEPLREDLARRLLPGEAELRRFARSSRHRAFRRPCAVVVRCASRAFAARPGLRRC